MGVFHLLGASSPIAQLLAKKLNLENEVFLYSSSGYGDAIKNFLVKAIDESTIIYFCNIQDDLNANIKLLNQVIDHCKKYNCKFIYISSINAQVPSASLYSSIKYECEKVVRYHGYINIRLAIVVSEPPISSYKALKGLDRLPVQFIFNENRYLHFTDIDRFLNLDFCQINSSINLYSYSLKLNDFFNRTKGKIIKIHMDKSIRFLKRVNKTYPLKSIFGRFLTLTAFERDFLK